MIRSWIRASRSATGQHDRAIVIKVLARRHDGYGQAADAAELAATAKGLPVALRDTSRHAAGPVILTTLPRGERTGTPVTGKTIT